MGVLSGQEPCRRNHPGFPKGQQITDGTVSAEIRGRCGRGGKVKEMA